MAGDLYRKPIMFAVVATVVILIGTVATMFYPMLTAEMHPKLENLKPFTALQLAGRDIYQREGCVNCHTQTVRPLKTEVLRYGEYSKAGEFAYDRPFLWGSKRTGPDLARVGGKYPDAWHYRHMENPQSMFAQSNMPAYAFLKEAKLDAAETEAHMKALSFPYQKEEIDALGAKTEMDAVVAYLQVIGTAVKKAVAPAEAQAGGIKGSHIPNPLAGKAEAIARGKELYSRDCASCHGADAKGSIGPSLVDDEFLYIKGDLPDDDYFEVVNNGTTEGFIEDGRAEKGGMPPFKDSLQKDDIWSIVSYLRSLKGR
ncbi:MAG: cbb3-type cytochrome c oxidase subunit II [Nitrospiraceae bacterium]|nr:cbb3-type cytochrome c oxidase subunit II [Nitrospiraceae bacterium]